MRKKVCTLRKEPKSSNYYMEAWFGEQTLTGRINTIAIVLMVVMLGGLL